MKARDIYNILKKFEINNERVILITGPYGSGKTFCVKKYIDEKRKNNTNKIKFAYISLCGRKNIDEVHTNLYHCINSKKIIIKKSISLISPAIQLIPKVGNKLNECLNNSLFKSNGSKTIKNLKGNTIVFIDDIDRTSENLKQNDIYEYVYQLVLNGLKIVLIGTDCESQNCGDIKEKLIDREYVIDETENEIIKSFFSEDKIDPEIYPIFKKNIRNAIKTSLFYKEINDYIEENNKQIFEMLPKNVLLYYISVFISNVNNEENEIDKNDDFSYEFLCEEIKNDSLAIRVYGIYKVIKQDDYLKRYFSNNRLAILTALANIYFSNSYEQFNNLFVKKDDENNIFQSKNLFYYSNKDKTLLINKILLNIENNTNPIELIEMNKLNECFTYQKFFPKDFNLDTFINIVSKRELGSNLKQIDFFRSEYNKEFLLFYDCLKDINNKKILENKKNEIITVFSNKNIDFLKCQNILDLLCTNEFYKENDKIKKDIEEIFINNNYFISPLNGDLSMDKWSICHKIVRFIIDFGQSDKLKLFLTEKIRESVEEEKERYEALLDKFK